MAIFDLRKICKECKEKKVNKLQNIFTSFENQLTA